MPSTKATSLGKVLSVASAYYLRSSSAYTTPPIFFSGQRICNNAAAFTTRRMSTSEGTSTDVEIEIEKKFAVNDQTSEILKSYGFDVVQKEEFVDWYFDLPAPQWKFCLDDCWFRYREKKFKIMNNWGWRGAWQVKRGKKGTRETDMTVYEELQGKAAKELILSMLSEVTINKPNEVDCKSTSQYSSHDIPHLEGAGQLVPFARIETFRTCWQPTATAAKEFSGLKVDIDKADSGYSVGEVEALCDGVSSDEDLESEKEKIRRFVDLITRESQSDVEATTIGKLEFVLMKESPDLYNACVNAGVINEPN